MAQPVEFDRPRPTPDALCPAPLRCESARKSFTVGPIREVVVFTPQNNRDFVTYALRTARGWFGAPLDPQALARAQTRSGSTRIDLNASVSNQDGVELFRVTSRGAVAPGRGGGPPRDLSVISTFCKVNDRGAVVCVDRGTVFSRRCAGPSNACSETGTRPAGLTDR